jgi:hypothetical protein
MEQYTNSVSLLLQHGQRFFEIWNFQIVIAVAAIGFIMSHDGLTAKNKVRVNITIVFLMIAIFSIYTESIHHQRETLMWNALEAHVAASPNQFLPEEVNYIDSLKPTPLAYKAGALVIADLLVIAITWLSPRMRESH